MGNTMFEQYGYKSAHELMTELARDISDGGDLIHVVRPTPRIKIHGYKFDTGYWSIICHRTNHGWMVVSIDYHVTEEELEGLMEVMERW